MIILSGWALAAEPNAAITEQEAHTIGVDACM
jgi:hypothetical protein